MEAKCAVSSISFKNLVVPAYIYALICIMDYRKKILNFLQRHRWLQHVLFWLVIILTYIPMGLLDDDSIVVILIMDLCIHIPQVLASYFFAYYLIPQFMSKKRYVYAIILFLLTTYLFSVMGRILTVHVGETLVRQQPFSQESIREILTDLAKLCFHYVPVIYSVVFQFLFVKYFFNFKRTKDKEMLLSKEKAEAELKTLKSQLNPHFLFNTLNNIYSLSLDNSPKTPLAIGKLSEILDHVLYKCNDELVSLSSEINLIRNYIELEKLRYDERLEVSLETTITNNTQVPPLILLSLVENAFKHGAGQDSGSPKIWIDIASDQQVLKVGISNTISSDYVSHDQERIGLSNIRKQLDLICPGRYQLEVALLPHLFKVILEINHNRP